MADPARTLGAVLRALGLEPRRSLREPSWNGTQLEEVYPVGHDPHGDAGGQPRDGRRALAPPSATRSAPRALAVPRGASTTRASSDDADEARRSSPARTGSSARTSPAGCSRDGHEVHLPRAAGARRRGASTRSATTCRSTSVDLADAAARRAPWCGCAAGVDLPPRRPRRLLVADATSHEMVRTNVVGTVNLVEACARGRGSRRSCNTGSSSEYGFKDHAPAETEWLEPNSDYAVDQGGRDASTAATWRAPRRPPHRRRCASTRSTGRGRSRRG